MLRDDQLYILLLDFNQHAPNVECIAIFFFWLHHCHKSMQMCEGEIACTLIRATLHAGALDNVMSI